VDALRIFLRRLQNKGFAVDSSKLQLSIVAAYSFRRIVNLRIEKGLMSSNGFYDNSSAAGN
jgi:hypothetical protein